MAKNRFKNNFIKKIIYNNFLGILFLFLSLSFAMFYVKNNISTASEVKTIKIGVYNNNPKVYRDNNGAIAGFFPDILNYISEQENWRLEYVFGTWEEGLTRLEKGEIDIMVDVAISEDRQRKFDFTNETILNSWAVILAFKNSSIQSFPDLNGKKIAIIKSSVYFGGPEGIDRYIKDFGLRAEFIHVNEYSEAFSLVENKKADVAVVSRIAALTNQKNYPNIKQTGIFFNPTQLRFAFTKGDSDNKYLIERLDFWMKKIKNGYSGIYQQILEKYNLAEITPSAEITPKWVAPLIFLGGIIVLFLLFIIFRLIKKRLFSVRQFYNLSERFKNLLATVPEIIMEVDNNKIYTWANNAGYDFFGKEVIGKEAEYYFEGKQEIYKKVESLFQGDPSTVYVESWQKRKDGESRLLAWWCRALKDEEGNVIGALSTARDITEKKVVEEKLKESEEKFKTLFESAKDSILILDADSGEITDSNPFIQVLLGYSPKELIGKKIFEISPFRDVIENKEKFLELQKKGYAYYNNLPLQSKSGEQKNVEFVSNVYLAGTKKVIQCNIRDITERIRTEKQLDQAKSEFLSLASHQLRTPLSATKWVLESLVDNHNLTQKQKDKFRDLMISNERLINLVNRVLNVTRIESGKLVVSKKMVDIKKLFKDLIASFRVLLDYNKKEIKIITSLGLKNIYCDPILIHEALENLLKNAIDYSGNNNKKICISIKERLDDYLISVHNDGIMDQSLIKKLGQFTKFTRGDNASNIQPTGSGLGLYITKKVVEANGGKVWLESNTKSRTTFYLTITKKKVG